MRADPAGPAPGRTAARHTGGAPQPLVQVGANFEDEYPLADALATECYANLLRAGDLLMELHNRYTFDAYQLSAGARQTLAVVDGAGRALEPTVIAQRLLVTTASMTSLLHGLEKRGLIRREPHPDDRRKVLVSITPAGTAIVDELLPSLHARERDVMTAALSPREQATLLRLVAKVQHAALEARTTPPPRAVRRRRARSST